MPAFVMLGLIGHNKNRPNLSINITHHDQWPLQHSLTY
ncbi:hypothetical protein IMCC1989_555 [gamma proteobacterium IMCC1989]|nr:hypothetical protein IMCC1989_555 [gamma proteobacterium IMCC1989]